MSNDLTLGLSPSIFGVLGDLEPFGSFHAAGPSSPTFDFSGDDIHPEVSHPEVIGPDFGLGFDLQAVPDVEATDMATTDMDDQFLNELLNLEPEVTPEWAKHCPTAAGPALPVTAAPIFDVKMELLPEMTAPVPRPPTGPGSRRKKQEEIKDELDLVIYALFPADVLRLGREEFQAWRDTSSMRPLTVPEQKRLSKIRRMILARVYAEKTRLRKIEESKNNGSTYSALKQENDRLRKKAQKLEAAQTKLQAQVKRLLAAQAILANRQ